MSGDMISQYNDGFVFYSDNVLSVTDENKYPSQSACDRSLTCD